jgi:hypothetical protein
VNQYREENITNLRKQINPDLGKVNFEDVVNKFVKLIDTLLEKPIIMGHSLADLAEEKNDIMKVIFM